MSGFHKRTLAALVLCFSAVTMLFANESLRFLPDNGGISLPVGFRAVVIADDIGRCRQIAVRANGDVYASLMKPVDRNYVVAMRDTDGDGRMDIIKYFGELDDRCKGLRIHNDHLYLSSPSQVVRFKLHEENLLPKGLYEVMVTGFPEQRSHRDKIFTFDDEGNIYVENGAPSNACQEQSRTAGSPGMDPCPQLARGAGIWRFRDDSPGQFQMEDGHHFATGIRNSIAMTWDPAKRELYVVQHGRDQLFQLWDQFYDERQGAELPAEEFQLVRNGSDFGWPYTYYDSLVEARMMAPEYGGDGKTKTSKGKYDEPLMTFPGHWAPNDLLFYNATQFPIKYQGGAFIAFHGSWNRAPLPQQGYNVVFVPFTGIRPSGGYEIFADGFKDVETLQQPSQARYRPAGLTVGPDGSLYIAESVRGRIWRVVFVGEETAPAKIPQETARDAATPQSPTPRIEHLVDDPEGRGLYENLCLSCHQADGSGVPDLQASLLESTKWSNHEYVIRLLLQGSEWVEDSQHENVMPVFYYLSDENLTKVLNYAKERFGGQSGDFQPSEIVDMRGRLGI